MAPAARSRAETALANDLLARLEMQGGIAPEGGQCVGQASGAEHPPGEVRELGVDAVDLDQAGAVELVRGRVQRRVCAGQAPVDLLAAGQVAQAGSVHRARCRPNPGGERLVEAHERRPDPLGDGGPQAGPEPLALRSGPAVRLPGAGGRWCPWPRCQCSRRAPTGPGAASPRRGTPAAGSACPGPGPRGRGRPRGHPRESGAGSPCAHPCRRAWRASARAWRPSGRESRPAGTHRPGAGGQGSHRAGPRSRRAARCR